MNPDELVKGRVYQTQRETGGKLAQKGSHAIGIHLGVRMTFLGKVTKVGRSPWWYYFEIQSISPVKIMLNPMGLHSLTEAKG